MGNESSKSKNLQSKKNAANATAIQKIQKAIPSVIKSNSAGPSSSIVQQYLEQANKTKTLKLKGMGMKAVPPIIEEVSLSLILCY